MKFDFWILLYIIDWFLFIICAGTVIYIGAFSIFSLFNKTNVINRAKLQRRFIILIPSFNQDEVI